MTTWTSMGNTPGFKVTPKPETLKHYSSITGKKTLDGVDITSIEAQLEISCDEFVEDNLILALLGEQITSGEIDLFAASSIYRQVKLVGTNDIGAQVQVIPPNVFFMCDKVLDLIGDKYGEIDLTGMPLRYSGSFGTLTFLDSALNGQPLSTPNPLNRFIGKGQVFTAPVGT